MFCFLSQILYCFWIVFPFYLFDFLLCRYTLCINWTSFFFFCTSIIFLSLKMVCVYVCVCIFLPVSGWKIIQQFFLIYDLAIQPLAVLWIFCPHHMDTDILNYWLNRLLSLCVSLSPLLLTMWPWFLWQLSFFVLIFRASADHYSSVFSPTTAVQKKSQEKLNYWRIGSILQT